MNASDAKRCNYLALSVLVVAAAGCTFTHHDCANCRAAEPELPWGSVRSVLGHGFGSVVVVEAKAVVERPSKGGESEVLVVSRVDGKPMAEDSRIHWTYGGWSAERAEEAGLHGFRLQLGRPYRLWGYETGQWVGVPPGLGAFVSKVSARSEGDFGWLGPQTWVLHYRSTFRVLTGEAL